MTNLRFGWLFCSAHCARSISGFYSLLTGQQLWIFFTKKKTAHHRSIYRKCILFRLRFSFTSTIFSLQGCRMERNQRQRNATWFMVKKSRKANWTQKFRTWSCTRLYLQHWTKWTITKWTAKRKRIALKSIENTVIN